MTPNTLSPSPQRSGPHWQHGIEREVEQCAYVMFLELTQGSPRSERWYGWYLCERHGGPPLIDWAMPSGQVACWDGEDILLNGRALADNDWLQAVLDALPEELAHRLCSRETPRFEFLNYDLRWAHRLTRADFQERVGQRVAALFLLARWPQSPEQTL